MSFQLRRMLALIALMSVFGTILAACGGGGGGTNASTGGAASTGGGASADAAVGGAASAEASMGGEASAMASTEASTGSEASAMASTEASTGSEASASGGAAASGAAASGAAASGGGSGQAATLPAECSNVQLQYWSPFTGPDGPFMQTLVDNFNQANPNIQVTYTAQAEYNTQLGTAAASDTLPDVAVINEDQVATQAFRNVIRPMPDEVVQLIGYGSSDFPEVAFKAGTVAGKQYAYPLSFVAMTMYYNEDLLKQAGLSAPPTNADEFAKAAQAMTQGENKGFLLTTGFPVQQIFQQLLHQYGGTEFSEDGTKATWNSDASVKALQWMKDAQAKYGEQNLEVDAELNAFKSGTVGMIWNGIWQLPNVTGEGVSFAGKATATPQIGEQPATWAGGPLLALPVHQSGTDRCKDLASGLLIKYLLDNSVEWAKAGNIPALNTARNSDAFKALPHASIAPSVENPVFPPAIPGIGDAFTPLSEAVSAIMSGNATDIKAALDDAANRADQILAQNKQQYGDAPQQ